MQRVTITLNKELGRDPTDQEIARGLGKTTKDIIHLRKWTIQPTYLDDTVRNDGDLSLTIAETIADENTQTPSNQAIQNASRHMIRELIARLSRRETTILQHRFGFDGGKEKTLEEVGVLFGITRERVRQIQNTALRKLRKMMQKIETGTPELESGTNKQRHRQTLSSAIS